MVFHFLAILKGRQHMSLILPFPFDSAAEDRWMGCKFVLWVALNLTNFFFDHLDPTILKMHPTSKNNEKWVHFIIMKSKPGPRAFIILNKIFSTENIYKNYISYLLFAHFFQVIFCIIKLILRNSLIFCCLFDVYVSARIQTSEKDLY